MKRLLIFFLIALAVRPVWAVQHVVPGAYPNAHQDMMHQPSAAQARAHGSALAATIASASGTKKVAVIIVQFQSGNAPLISGSRLIQSVSNIKNNFDQMIAYYTEVSYGKLALSITYFNSDTVTLNGDASPSLNQTGVYTLPHPMEYYGCGDEGAGCTGVTAPTQGANGNYLTRDAIDAARNSGHTGLTAANFDEVIVVHSGNGNETTVGTNGDIWSIFYSQDPVISGQSPADAVAAAAGFSEGDVVPETQSIVYGISSPLGVMCHEFGHSLGLPDLYNTSAIGGSSVVGKWELMDSGPYAGPANQGGTNPSHMCAWDKAALGWVAPTVSGSRQNVNLSPVEMNASALKIPVLNGLPQEYFLVEYRLHTSGAQFDRYIPGDGLLVWHIDDAITSSRGINATAPGTQNTVNTGNPHYGVSIVTADGTTVGLTGGGPGNPFGNGHNFTAPVSDTFGGQPSGISLVSIGGVGSSAVTSQVANLVVSAGQSIVKLINFPNPAGKRYAHPSGEGHTTIQAQLTRPANDFSILIYTLSGDLVRKIGLTDATLNLNRSADEKWVYEYVWDLTNGDGKMVAPGVYLYLLRVDGISQSNKLVIIR